MKVTKKDIFGNVYTTEKPIGSMRPTYKQRLQQEKQKDAYNQYIKQKRIQQIKSVKQGIQTTGKLSRIIAVKTGTTINKSRQRITNIIPQKTIKNKLYTLIKGQPPSIYSKEKRQ